MAVTMAKSARNDKPSAITPIEYGGLQAAFDHFSKELFGDTLPDVFITYQRQSHTRGYFSAERFSGRTDQQVKHELALNPDHFFDRTDEEVCSTLVHEQVHLWQHTFGTPSKRRYHNRQWADKMQSLGLMPSTTGALRRTGQRVTHYVIPDGLFAQAFATLAAGGWKLNLQSAIRNGANGGRNSKTKFTCLSCGQNAWGKPELAILCELCSVKMAAAGDDQMQAA